MAIHMNFLKSFKFAQVDGEKIKNVKVRNVVPYPYVDKNGKDNFKMIINLDLLSIHDKKALEEKVNAWLSTSKNSKTGKPYTISEALSLSSQEMSDNLPDGGFMPIEITEFNTLTANVWADQNTGELDYPDAGDLVSVTIGYVDTPKRAEITGRDKDYVVSKMAFAKATEGVGFGSGEVVAENLVIATSEENEVFKAEKVK